MQMDRSLVHLPAGTPVCSISVHPTLPAQWLLSRCKTGALPIIVQLPAMQQVPLHAHFLRCGWRTPSEFDAHFTFPNELYRGDGCCKACRM